MYGADMGTFAAYTRNADGLKQVLDTKGINKDLWIYFSTTVESSSNWTVVFRGLIYDQKSKYLNQSLAACIPVNITLLSF